MMQGWLRTEYAWGMYGCLEGEFGGGWEGG